MPIDPKQYPNTSNRDLFAELDRLSILCDNVRTLVERLVFQGDYTPELVIQLRRYWEQQTDLQIKLQKFIINTRQG